MSSVLFAMHAANEAQGERNSCRCVPINVRSNAVRSCSTVLKLIITRLWQGVVVLLIVSALTFWLLAAAGGGALPAFGAQPMVSQTALADLRHVYGLDQPLAVRYLHWLADLLRGRMGYSFYFHAPVLTIILPRLLR